MEAGNVSVYGQYMANIIDSLTCAIIRTGCFSNAIRRSLDCVPSSPNHLWIADDFPGPNAGNYIIDIRIMPLMRADPP